MDNKKPEYRSDAWRWTESVDGVELGFVLYDDQALQIVPPDGATKGKACYVGNGTWDWVYVFVGGRKAREKQMARKCARKYKERKSKGRPFPSGYPLF